MSILVKGMRMPKACYECRMYEADIYYCAAAERDIDISSSDEGRCSFCPLAPVPPHGRLIDADEFLNRAIGTKCFRGDYALMLEELVGESTTIIPASEESE